MAPMSLEQLSDRDLFRRIQAGEPGAFELIFDRYGGPILNYIYRMTGDWQTAEDVAQETFVRAYRHIRSFRFESEPRTWLYRIATNLVRNSMRRAARQREVRVQLFGGESDTAVDHILEGVDESHRPDRMVIAREFERILQEEINALPERLRAAVVMCDIENHSYEEAAQIMGISYDAIRQRHSRARRRLDRGVARRLADERLAGSGLVREASGEEASHDAPETQ